MPLGEGFQFIQPWVDWRGERTCQAFRRRPILVLAIRTELNQFPTRA